MHDPAAATDAGARACTRSSGSGADSDAPTRAGREARARPDDLGRAARLVRRRARRRVARVPRVVPRARVPACPMTMIIFVPRRLSTFISRDPAIAADALGYKMDVLLPHEPDNLSGSEAIRPFHNLD